MYGKQTSALFIAVSKRIIFTDNVLYDGPRAVRFQVLLHTIPTCRYRFVSTRVGWGAYDIFRHCLVTFLQSEQPEEAFSV